MRLPNVDWALVAALPLLLMIVGIAGGIVWLAAEQGSYGWGLLAIVLGGILVQLHRDKLSLTDNSGEPIGMPIVPSRAAEKRARPGLRTCCTSRRATATGAASSFATTRASGAPSISD